MSCLKDSVPLQSVDRTHAGHPPSFTFVLRLEFLTFFSQRQNTGLLDPILV